MKLIIGLGNPGEEYTNTRHNIGFEIINKLKENWNFSDFEFNKKFNAEISKGDQELILVKPSTFMNLSGETVGAILDFYKLTSDDIIVIHDDLDIGVGNYKLATDSSSAGHNGVQNIIEKLGTQKFLRVRVGIGEITTEGVVKCRLGAHDFVLGKFTAEEREKITAIENEIIETVENLLN